jgi:hypothetical protein
MLDFWSGFGCLQLVLLIIVCAAVVSIIRSILRWKVRQYLVSNTPRPFGATLYATLFNPLRRSLNIRPLRIIPRLPEADHEAIDLLERADRLAREIRTVLKQSPASGIRKADCERQARAVPDNLVNSLWTLARLRRIYDTIDPASDQAGQSRQTIANSQERLLAEMRHSVERLSTIPVLLMQVELARGDESVGRLAKELDATNQRLIDLSSAYVEIKELSHLTSV